MPRLITILGLLVFVPALHLPAGEEASPSPGAAEAGIAGGEEEEETLTCFWKSILPDPDFRPQAGDAYLISITGSDRARLVFSYRRLKPHQGSPRIAVHTQKTSDNRILVDQENAALFAAGTGEFILSLVVPSGWPVYLVEDQDNPYADPVVLSNIVELP